MDSSFPEALNSNQFFFFKKKIPPLKLNRIICY